MRKIVSNEMSLCCECCDVEVSSIEPKYFEANSGAVKFRVRRYDRNGCYYADRPMATLSLISKDQPMKSVYELSLDGLCVDLLDQTKMEAHTYTAANNHCREIPEYFWLTWHSAYLRMGFGKDEPFLIYFDKDLPSKNIGYIKLSGHRQYATIKWIYDSPPVIKTQPQLAFEDGKLEWVLMTGRQLPQNALIGGFEDEPLYIARARHRGSLCPGKYVPSKFLAFVPWGGSENAKEEFEILCGYNAKWVETTGDLIPQHAFIGGTSEVGGEPLYICRAMHEGNLIPGKVHLLYKTGYLPYREQEIEVTSFEVLVPGDVIPNGIVARPASKA